MTAPNTTAPDPTTPTATTAPQTDPSSSVAGTDGPVDDRPTCSVCPHPWSAHDRLGIRFCTATEASLSTSPSSAATRGCICV